MLDNKKALGIISSISLMYSTLYLLSIHITLPSRAEPSRFAPTLPSLRHLSENRSTDLSEVPHVLSKVYHTFTGTTYTVH